MLEKRGGGESTDTPSDTKRIIFLGAPIHFAQKKQKF